MTVFTDPHLAYRADFPTVGGYVIYPGYLPKHLLAAYEEQIRIWCKGRDRKQWPPMVLMWAEEKKRLK